MAHWVKCTLQACHVLTKLQYKPQIVLAPRQLFKINIEDCNEYTHIACFLPTEKNGILVTYSSVTAGARVRYSTERQHEVWTASFTATREDHVIDNKEHAVNLQKRYIMCCV